MVKFKLPYVHQYRDRHGKLRYYFRRRGCPQVPLLALPGSSEFMDEYRAALDEAPRPNSPGEPTGTVGRLVIDFFRSTEFSNLKPSSRKTYKSVLDKLRQVHGHRLVCDLQAPKARKIIEEIGVDRPAMANLTRAVFRRLMEYAIELGLRYDNPFNKVPKYRLGTHHTWTDDEISTFEKRWPVGTRERLAFALLLFTGQRGSDVVKMRRSDIKNGMIRVLQQKTARDQDDHLLIPIHPALERAMRTSNVIGLYLLGDEKGRRPITRQSLTRLIRLAVKAAALPRHCVAHGLRKAALRRLAEFGSTTKEISAVSGHRTLAEIERYTRRSPKRRYVVSLTTGTKDEHPMANRVES
jgi:integrase